MAEVLSRRTVLRGMGTAVSLPLLEAMVPARGAAAAAAAAHPLRIGFLYVPNGKHMPDWTPAQEGSGYDLPWILEPLAAHRDRFTVISGLAHMKANANGDGGGDHARALTTFLTGTQAKKTFGADIRAGVSVDQLAAGHLGRQTRFPSLEIGADAGGQSGNCDSGYSCAYSANIAWKSETQPIPKETNPRLVFERLFTDGRPGETEAQRAARRTAHKSILDFVAADARRLEGRLGGADRRKLDEYLTAVREVERRIEHAGAMQDPAALGMERPDGVPGDYESHLRLLADVLALAWRTDTTRVSTFVFANEGSNRSYAFMDVPEGHHDLSHHGNDPAKQEKIRRINRFHVTQLAYFLDALAAVPEGEGTLLDHSMIIYGSGIGDGNRHNHDDLPILLAGGGAGTLQPGRHLRVPPKTPMTNLYLALLDRLGVHAERLGDSTGRLEGV
jgi:hypothetical protein